MSGYRFCTQCGGASVHRVKRHWWQRVLNRLPQYHCEDCGIIHQVSHDAKSHSTSIDCRTQTVSGDTVNR